MDLVQKEKKKKEEEAGFDPLKASYLAKGLIAGGDDHSVAHHAIGQTQAHEQTHHSEKLKTQESKFKADIGRQHESSVRLMRGKLSMITPKKLILAHSKRPHQLKKPDVENPSSSKGGSGKK